MVEILLILRQTQNIIILLIIYGRPLNNVNGHDTNQVCLYLGILFCTDRCIHWLCCHRSDEGRRSRNHTRGSHSVSGHRVRLSNLANIKNKANDVSKLFIDTQM